MTCLTAVVFLPLPSMEAAASLSYRAQLIPFYFIYSLIKEPCLGGLCGILFNILMTIPYGMYLRYFHGFSKKEVLLLGFALTLIIEIGQLTGLFFMFPGSYRLFDVDDIMHNLLGCYLGCLLVCRFDKIVPAISAFDVHFDPRSAQHIH